MLIHHVIERAIRKQLNVKKGSIVYGGGKSIRFCLHEGVYHNVDHFFFRLHFKFHLSSGCFSMNVQHPFYKSVVKLAKRKMAREIFKIKTYARLVYAQSTTGRAMILSEIHAVICIFGFVSSIQCLEKSDR